MPHLIDTSKLYTQSKSVGGYWCIHCGVEKSCGEHDAGCPVGLLEKATLTVYSTVYYSQDECTRTEQVTGNTIKELVGGVLYYRKEAKDFSDPDRFDSDVRIGFPDIPVSVETQLEFLSELTQEVVGLRAEIEAQRKGRDLAGRILAYQNRLHRLELDKDLYKPEAYERLLQELNSSYPDVLKSLAV